MKEIVLSSHLGHLLMGVSIFHHMTVKKLSLNRLDLYEHRNIVKIISM